MNNLQKTLLSAVAIFSFGFYAYTLRTQNDQVIAINAASADIAQQGADVSSNTSSSNFQAYVEQINTAASQVPKTQPPKPSVRVARGEDDGEYEDDGYVLPVVARTPTPNPTPVTPTAAQPVAPQPSPAQQPVQQVTAPQSGQYRNGTYTGSSVDVYYGFVQVEAVIQGGKIASVNFLRYPSDRNTSVRINSQAMPLLSQEAIQAQSANVSGVSGASATSQGFVQSLGDALAQAHA